MLFSMICVLIAVLSQGRDSLKNHHLVNNIYSFVVSEHGAYQGQHSLIFLFSYTAIIGGGA